MLNTSTYTPITGTFVSCLMGDNLDYCAWQDKYFLPNCRFDEIEEPVLDEWYSVAKRITNDAGIEFWANVETFQRGSTLPENREYRQVDYRCLAAKLQSASKFADKIVTFQFSTCMSPNAEWGSSRRLLERYLEMIGLNTEIIDS